VATGTMVLASPPFRPHDREALPTGPVHHVHKGNSFDDERILDFFGF